MTDEILHTTCCVVGGGPAGMMLGYLLARRGVEVTVLEKHQDFFRDFRGDTVHPSTLEVLNELGLLEEFLRLPHEEVTSLGVIIGGSFFDVADFRHVPVSCKFVALMPQWDFLNFLSDHAKRFPSFRLLMQHEATELLRDGDRITGVVAQHEGQTVGCIPIWWWAAMAAIPLRAERPECKSSSMECPSTCCGSGSAASRAIRPRCWETSIMERRLILINRSDYFQAGLIIAKGSYEEIRAGGLDAFRADLRKLAPYLGERVNEVHDWEQVKILTVQINRLRRWYRPGLLCIGDAAHAMSPAGGVGINLAIQDAVATANLLTGPLRSDAFQRGRWQQCKSGASFQHVLRRRFSYLLIAAWLVCSKTPGQSMRPGR